MRPRRSPRPAGTGTALVAGLVTAIVTGLLVSGASLHPASALTEARTGSATGATTAACAPRWLASWTAASTDGVVGQPAVEQTLRVRVRTAHAGTSLRIRLSNRFGLGPVTFGAVTIGRQDTGAAILPGSLRSVRFDGAARTVLPRGTERLSDPIGLAVEPGESLLVSLHVVGLPGPATQHALGTQTTWASLPLTGNRTRQLSGTGFLPRAAVAAVPLPQDIPYVAGLDVRSQEPSGTVVAFGDSITDGFQGTLIPVLPAPDQIDRDTRYPDWLNRRLRTAGSPLGVVNAGISGNQLLADGSVPIFGPSGLSRFDRDALGLPGVRTVILLEGINDIGQSFATPAELIAGYREAIARAHARGVRILLGTLTPDEGTLQPGYGIFGEATRAAVNAWIRGQREPDGVIDFDRAVADPPRPTRIRPGFDGGDRLHFTAAGYRAMAAAIPLDALGRPGC